MTSAPKRVLVLYSRVGGGHLSAARALAAELDSSGHATAKLVDAYVDSGLFPTTLFPGAYARLARAHPRLWWLVYHYSTSLNPRRVLGPFLERGFRRQIGEFRPDVVVSVLPAINGLLARAAQGNAVRLEVVLTDWHSVHRFWVAAGVDHYTAPTESARLDCIRFGAPPASVDVVGIPVRREFALSVERASVRARLSDLGMAADKFTILAMVGAEGSPRALNNIARVVQLDLDAQMLVICGHNAKLRRRVEDLAAGMPVRALGFVENVADLMRACDLLVTKAGGVTLAEAFCGRVPVVVHDVLPGQEAGNLEYVLRQAAVSYAPDPAALARIVRELVRDPARRAALAERGARLARPAASQQIVRGLLQRAAAKSG
ncbi:MAG: glycosyltransferase [Chloroflexi bacterium]|nr:glycosyltransferase [Chloroflexota bacterium]